MCPEVIVMLGEDLTRFRDASKDNYDFLRNYSWSKKVERLGFDEVSYRPRWPRVFFPSTRTNQSGIHGCQRYD